MNWKTCLWFKFGQCPEIDTPCIRCNREQPTTEEFNTLYKNFQDLVKTAKEFDKKICKRNRKWNKWVNKKHDRYFPDGGYANQNKSKELN